MEISSCNCKFDDFLVTSTAWSLRKNIRPKSFMYGPGPTGDVSDFGLIFSRNDHTLGQ